MMREPMKFGVSSFIPVCKGFFFVVFQAFIPQVFFFCWCENMCVSLYACVGACMFDFVESACVVDGVKPTVSVDSIGLLAPIGRMNAEHCGLEWGWGCFGVTVCV